LTTSVAILLAIQGFAILCLAVVIFALARQIGVLHQRIGPVGALALSKQVRVGEKSPEFRLDTLDGEALVIGAPAPDGRSTLITFLTPNCPVCAQLLPALRSIARAESNWLRLVFASDGDPGQHAEFRKKNRLEDSAYVLSPELGMTYEIGKLPYGVLLDENGVVAAQGLTNSREHVESLFEAKRLGVSSIQEFLERRDEGPALIAGGSQQPS
jgi:methylamine dehydrogenase accessory protein MauD